jgi:hypothetical protein
MTNQNPNYNLRERPEWSARALPPEPTDFITRMLERATPLLAEDFKGVTTDGNIVPGLFSLAKTGASTERIKIAVDTFLGSLAPEQRSTCEFPLDSKEWHRWSNVHPFLIRHGVCMDGMESYQRDLALGVIRESLSQPGFETVRNSMKLNSATGEMLGSDEEYGEWLYWLSVMGKPSLDAPWGWQLDGHHMIINCFVLGDQVVMTPMFMGSEPIKVNSGKFAGTRAYDAEVQGALKLGQSFDKAQRSKVILGTDLPPDVFTSAYRDNFEMKYEGIKFGDLSSSQQSLTLDLAGTYIGRMRPEYADVKMEEIKKHLKDTHIAWIGGTNDDDVFYYRIHSPVVLIEFDHNRGIAFDNDKPSQNHVHSVVRTPNGNDYGKDLLRQHREQAAHADQ